MKQFWIVSLFGAVMLLSCQKEKTPSIVAPPPPPPPPALKLLGHLPLPFFDFVTDVWGYSTGGREYALVGGHQAGFAIVDVTDPAAPEVTAVVDSVPGFDVKVWQHYAYGVNGSNIGEGVIVDIADPANPQIVGSFPSAHNIFIREDGYLFAEFRGLKIYDLNPDPTAPVLLWSGGTEGHDATVIGNTLYDFHGRRGTHIYDVTTIELPELLTSIQDPTIAYHHSGWPTPDGRYLFICDELATPATSDITVWAIGDLMNPTRVGGFSDQGSRVHNLYIIGKYAIVSYYTAGLRILDISDPTHPEEAHHYDTSSLTGEGFHGAFGAYPFTGKKLIYVSDIEEGLYVFRFEGI